MSHLGSFWKLDTLVINKCVLVVWIAFSHILALFPMLFAFQKQLQMLKQLYPCVILIRKCWFTEFCESFAVNRAVLLTLRIHNALIGQDRIQYKDIFYVLYLLLFYLKRSNYNTWTQGPLVKQGIPASQAEMWLVSSHVSDSCRLAPDSVPCCVKYFLIFASHFYHVLAFKQRYGSTLKALERILRLHMFTSILISRLFALKLNDNIINCQWTNQLGPNAI